MVGSFTLRRSGQPSDAVVEEMLAGFELFCDANSTDNTAQLAKNLGTRGSALDGRLGATTGVEATDPLLLPLLPSRYVQMIGATTNVLSIPHAAPISLTGKVTLRMAWAPDDATPAAQGIFYKGTSWTAAGINYGLGIDATGHVVMKATDSANTLRTWTSTVTTWAIDKAVVLVEGTVDPVTAACVFRTKVLTSNEGIAAQCADNTGWVAHGASVPGTVTGASLLANAIALTVNGGSGATCPGKLFYADVRDATGVIVASFDPNAAVDEAALSWVNVQGQTVTVGRATTGLKTSLVFDTAKWLFAGTLGTYIEVPDDPAVDIAAGESLTAFVITREFATQSTGSYLLGKQDGGAATPGWRLNKSATASASATVNDGIAPYSVSQAGFAAATLHMAAMTVSATKIREYSDGTPTAQVTHSGLTFVNAFALRVGRAADAGTSLYTGEVIAFGVTKRKLSNGEIQAISNYYRSTSTETSYGSALRPGENQTSALRGDAGTRIGPGGDTLTGSYFTAVPTDYDTVKLEWHVPEAPDVVSIRIAVSPNGHPVTPLDGRSVISVGSGVAIYTTEDTSARSGAWHYYSLFVQISDGNGLHYELVSTAECLVPTNYGSTASTYLRIPEWYRSEDGRLASDGLNGPLRRFIDLVGFDVDYTRTLATTIANIRQPQSIRDRALLAAGRQLGIHRQVEGISESRYRDLIRNAAYLREHKGTLEGIRAFISALTGSDAEVEQIGADNITIKVHAQRVNLIVEPQMTGALWSEGTSGTAGISYAAGSCLMVGGGSGGAAQTAIGPIPLLGDISYSFGALVTTATAGAVFSVFGIVAAGPSAGQTVNFTLKKAFGIGQQRIETVPTKMPAGTTSVALYIAATIPANGAVTFREPVLEFGAVGDYFDGDTVSGGFLPGSTGLQDFRWGATDNASVSYYSLNYGVNASVIKNVLPYIVPVGVKVGTDGVDRYTITDMNWYPGKP